jgi:SatD family (SatD)
MHNFEGKKEKMKIENPQTHQEHHGAESPPEHKHIILMADIIGSSLLPRQELQTFFDVVEEVNARHADTLASMLTVTLGDEFQAIVSNPKALMSIMIDIEETLIRKNSRVLLRYVAHKGLVETQIHHRRAHAMVGPGLTFARKTLESMKKGDDRFFIQIGPPKQDLRLSKALKVWGGFLQHWKENDKHLEIAPTFLDCEDYKLVAAKLGTERGNMWRIEKSLRFRDYLAQRELLTLL